MSLSLGPLKEQSCPCVYNLHEHRVRPAAQQQSCCITPRYGALWVLSFVICCNKTANVESALLSCNQGVQFSKGWPPYLRMLIRGLSLPLAKSNCLR